MEHMSLQEITTACGGTYYGEPSLLTREVSGVAIDSRKAGKDFLFVPIKGARVDGHSFIPQVMEQGALCTLSEHPLSDSSPYILVSSCAQALKDIQAAYPDREVIGIMTREVIYGGGNIHCITQQIPASGVCESL